MSKMTREGIVNATVQNKTVERNMEMAQAPDVVKVTIAIPRECPECGFWNFNVWGTKMNGMTSIVVKCMRCGK